MNKKCTTCKEVKFDSDFCKDKSRHDGFSSRCRPCSSKQRLLSPSGTRGTLPYFKKHGWALLNQRTINGSAPLWSNKFNRHYLEKGTRLDLNKTEFYEWCDFNKEIISSLYLNGETPTVDRINSALHYSLDNMRVVSLHKNVKSGGESTRQRFSVRLKATDVSSGECIIFDSWCDAKRKGFHVSSIYSRIGTPKPYRGFIWERVAND